MNSATNSNSGKRKSRIFELIFQEWVFEVLLLVAVVGVVVEGFSSLSGPGIV